jgi:hypothetical protein
MTRTTRVSEIATMSDTQEIDDASEFRTKDMALAAYLGCIEHKYKRMELDDESCYWVFAETEALADEVMTFLEGGASVEPNQFNSNFAKLKRDMFDFFRANGLSTSRRT